ETREAQRIGRIALKAGLGELDITEDDLFAAFEDLAARFHGKADGDRSDRNVKQSSSSQRTAPEAVETGAAADGDPEA
ncbi:TraC family protein, partial [Acinetobacter baumannii]